MPGVHEADAVWADERSAISVDGIQYTVFEQGSFVRLLAKSGGQDDKSADILLGGQRFYGIGTQGGGNGQHRQVRIGHGMYVGISLHALHFGFLGVHRTQFAGVSAAYQVFQNGATGFMDIV